MKVEHHIVCKSCKGTGLYRGMAERDNCAVICHDCKGTGGVFAEYEPFEGLVRRDDIKRVFAGSFGFVHTDKDVQNSDDGTMFDFSKYGCSYNEWLAGFTPKPMEQLYCPYIFENRGIGHEPLPKCEEMAGCGHISRCKYYADKAKCWEEFRRNGGLK